jgi:hypothetical protein
LEHPEKIGTFEIWATALGSATCFLLVPAWSGGERATGKQAILSRSVRRMRPLRWGA